MFVIQILLLSLPHQTETNLKPTKMKTEKQLIKEIDDNIKQLELLYLGDNTLSSTNKIFKISSVRILKKDFAGFKKDQKNDWDKL
jgi:homoserine trans-succinylase